MDQKKLYTIGEVSKLCNISTRQLRYYDDLGVLKPSYRDDVTGYRYYTEDQFPILMFLYDLKQIGLSNDSIQRLMGNRDVRLFVQELRRRLIDINAEVQAALHKYDYVLNSLLRTTDAIAYLQDAPPLEQPPLDDGISLVQVPPCKILYTRYRSDWRAQNSPTFAMRFAEINKLMEQYHLTSDGSKIAILYHGAMAQFSEDLQDNKGIYEVATRIPEAQVPDGLTEIRDFGGFEAISAIHVGKFSEAVSLYHMMYRWAKEHHMETEDTSIEEYWINSFVSSNMEQYVTRIYLPLKGSKI